MRRKSAPAPAASPMDEAPADETMDEGMHQENAPSEGSKPTAFLPKEMGGGKMWKPGDEIVLRIDAVDPETGEMQVSYAPEKPGDADEPSDSMEAMDKQMPATGDY